MSYREENGQVNAETLQSILNDAWIQFLVEHPTRGGLAERLIFEAGWKAHEALEKLR